MSPILSDDRSERLNLMYKQLVYNTMAIVGISKPSEIKPRFVQISKFNEANLIQFFFLARLKNPWCSQLLKTSQFNLKTAPIALNHVIKICVNFACPACPLTRPKPFIKLTENINDVAK